MRTDILAFRSLNIGHADGMYSPKDNLIPACWTRIEYRINTSSINMIKSQTPTDELWYSQLPLSWSSRRLARIQPRPRDPVDQWHSREPIGYRENPTYDGEGRCSSLSLGPIEPPAGNGSTSRTKKDKCHSRRRRNIGCIVALLFFM